jgi:hypothetical protein
METKVGQVHYIWRSILKEIKMMYPIICKIQILWTSSTNFLNRPRIFQLIKWKSANRAVEAN